ncbi:MULTISPECIES: rhodanese-like domain-containing protein [unclassified Actinopolyspora]|uniref:rhodanese-like domain-containing protein n=1 Tax=unclassified Actinopolyspora TaxID=2639451 RepID=UPI0013F5B46C|nr:MULTISPECIES: rhodanese-like domain-containing protein [unclassified Actinopolyspora]NHD18132.1 rhodanese-like domain-containing protein [Actinopolyspora sp. BKK2]NHE77191.1 rhodanese-like domain-containing protein [Actinopolyspora sp. BKK1]
MDTPAVRELIGTNPRTRLIDVRTPGEFTTEHAPGSHNVPLDLLRERSSELVSAHEDPVVLVCASGNRAEQARELLESAGFTQAQVLRGGLGNWQEHGAPVEHGSGTWSLERQVRLVAGSLVLLGVAGSVLFRPLKWLAGFVGAGLTFAAVSNTCAMARLLELLPHNRAPRNQASELLAALTDRHPPASSGS